MIVDKKSDNKRQGEKAIILLISLQHHLVIITDIILFMWSQIYLSGTTLNFKSYMQ